MGGRNILKTAAELLVVMCTCALLVCCSRPEKTGLRECFQKGKELFYRSDFNGALEQFDKGLKINKKDKKCLLFRAGCLCATGKGDDARKAYARTHIDRGALMKGVWVADDTVTFLLAWRMNYLTTAYRSCFTLRQDMAICDAILEEAPDASFFREMRRNAEKAYGKLRGYYLGTVSIHELQSSGNAKPK